MKTEAARDIAKLWYAKRQARRRFTLGALNLAPMMDVMFNLLIFFLVTTSFTLPEALLTARMPRTTGLRQEARIPLVPIKIYLEPASPGTTSMIRVSSAVQTDATALVVVEDFGKLYHLLDALGKKTGISDETPVIIAARDATVWDRVVNAYNSAVRARYKQVVFAEWK